MNFAMRIKVSFVLAVCAMMLTNLAWAANTDADSVLTAKNNKEFAAILKLRAEHDPSYSAFAEKYAGRTIEFDGNIAYMSYHGSYKTRYDFLIYVGNYTEEGPFYGPHFKFQDVNVFQLNLTGSKTVRMGDNLRIVAKVESYNNNTGIFFITPVSCKAR